MSSINSSLPATALYNQIVKKGLSQSVADFVKQTPSVKAQEDAFKKSVARYASPNDLFKNYNDLKLVLTSLGAGSQIDNIGLLKKVVASDIKDSKSLVNQLNNSSLKQINQVLNTKGDPTKSLQDPDTQSQIINAYNLASYQSSLNDVNPALTPALNFGALIKSATSIYDILGNSTLRQVVGTVGRIPQQVVNQTVEAQAAAFSKVFDISKAQDDRYVQNFIKRYLGTSDANAAAASSGTSSLLSLFQTGGSSSGVSA